MPRDDVEVQRPLAGGRRRVSFDPLTPHNKDGKAMRSKPKTPGNRGNRMSLDKENQQSAVSSFRRSLRATMTSPMSDKENSNSMMARSGHTSTTTTTQPSALAARQHAQRRPLLKPTGLSAPSQRIQSSLSTSWTPASLSTENLPKTPASILHSELDSSQDVDESLLITPSNRTFAQMNPMELESLLEESPLEKAETASVVAPSSASPSESTSIVVEETLKSDTSSVDKLSSTELQQAIQQNQRRVARTKKDALVESETYMGATPYQKRGNGVQMDLSDMFLATQRSPEAVQKKKKKLPDRLRVTVHGRDHDAKAARKTEPKATLMPQASTTVARPTTKMKTPMVPKAVSRRTTVRTTSQSSTQSRSSPGSSIISTAASERKVILDKDWADKQCEAFASWLNYLFHPSEDKDHENSLTALEQQGHNAVAVDRMALRTLILHRRMAQVRGKAMELFHSDSMRLVVRKIDAENAKGRLALRADRNMYADLTLRGQITSLLLSYSTPWLRLGLETVYGEIISPETPSQLSPQKTALMDKGVANKTEKAPLSRMKFTLRNFIVKRVLSDPDTLSKYTNGRCKVPSGNFEKKYQAEMRVFTLRRLFTLVFFLDRAKEANILDKFPRLFTKGAKVKSSRDVLIALCRDFLSSEGDITKHLGRIGLKVTYKQEPIDEIEFKITNLATDLRDGVRLARMTEILTKTGETKSLLKTLRLPAVSRLQKLHNVGVVLEKLIGFGALKTEDLASHHIVDGHREMVLKLMWSVVSHCGLGLVLKPELIESEIQIVRHANQRRRRKWEHANGVRAALEASHSAENEQESMYRRLLLEWCNAVCSCYGSSVSNLTTSFADGTILCLLVHYYHPGLLSLGEIQSTTQHLPTGASVKEREAALKRERQNFELASDILNDLGGIPRMLTVSDSQKVPEEKSMLLCLAYICSRLMESSKEIMASIAIQICFRRYRRRVELERKLVAALIIIRTWREAKENYFAAQRQKYLWSVRIIEAFVVEHRHAIQALRAQRLARQELDRAAILIQSHIRRILAEDLVLPILLQSRAAVLIQSHWRRVRKQNLYELILLERDCATMIQQQWRCYRERQRFLDKIWAAHRIQSCFRNFTVTRQLNRVASAATQIQRIWRGFWCQLQFQLDLMDIIAVQSVFRRRAALVERKTRISAVLLLQRCCRRLIALSQTAKLVAEKQEKECQVVAAISCQKSIRRFLATINVQSIRSHRSAATSIQSRWRGGRECSCYKRKRKSAVRLQAIFRGRSSRRGVAFRDTCAVAVQAKWRCMTKRLQYRLDLLDIIFVQSVVRRYIAKVQSERLKQALMILQRTVRRWLAFRFVCGIREEREAHLHSTAAAVLIQATARRHLAKKWIKARFHEADSAIRIQSFWRVYCARKTYINAVRSAILIQSIFRRQFALQEVARWDHCATLIQCNWRGFSAFFAYQLVISDILLLQRIFRGHLSRRRRQRRETAVNKLQKIARLLLATRYISFLTRQSNLSASRVQAVFRGYLLRRKLCVLSQEAANIQRIFRGYTARLTYELDLIEIIVVQSIARSWLAKRYVSKLAHQRQMAIRAKESRRKMSATRVQAVFRGYLLRLKLWVLSQDATNIQRVFRGYTARMNYELDLINVIIVQSIVRCWSSRRKYHDIVTATLRLQQAARHWRALSFRRQKQEQHRQHAAARMIQKTWRCYDVHVGFMLIIISAVTIQTAFRGFMSKKVCRKLIRGIVSLQDLGRRWLARLGAERKATIIESRARSFIATSKFRQQKTATVCIQRHTRGLLARVELDLCHFASAEIQRTWRGYHANTDFVVKILSGITIQCAFRSYKARCLLQVKRHQFMMDFVEFLFLEKQAERIQRAFREYVYNKRLAEKVSAVQGAVRGFLTRNRVKRMHYGISLLQGAIRGRLVRQYRSKKVTVIARRIARASAKAREDPSMKLDARTAAALLVLQNSTRLSEIMAAVAVLEMSTRLSLKCCIAFTECTAIEVLYGLIRTCNRSLPHVELLSHILLTFRNVVRYEVLIPRVASSDSAEIFMDLVQMFRDKENVFCSAAVLLYLVVASNAKLRKHFATAENVKRLKGVHSLCIRKLSASSTSRRSMSAPSRGKHDKAFHWKHGVGTLQRLISLLEQQQ